MTIQPLMGHLAGLLSNNFRIQRRNDEKLIITPVSYIVILLISSQSVATLYVYLGVRAVGGLRVVARYLAHS